MKEQASILVAIADDHIMMRKGTVAFINSYPGFHVIIEADNGKHLLQQIEEVAVLPDIAVLDISMPEMNGYETAIQLRKRWPEIKILVLTMIKDEFSIIQMLRSGALGYVLKASHPDELHKALQDVYEDRYYSSELIASSVLKAVAHRKGGGFPELSEKELQIIKLYSKGLDSKDIAKEMGISTRTVDGYRDSLYLKLDVHSLVELVIFALKNGLTSP